MNETGNTKTTLIDIHVKAPGKVILHGEHSVVYGKLAVASSIGLWTHLILKECKSSKASFILNFSAVNVQCIIPVQHIIAKILNNGTVPLRNELAYNFEQPENVAYDSLIQDIWLYVRLATANQSQQNALVAFLYLYIAMLHPSAVTLNEISITVQTEITIGAGMGSSASFAVCIAAAFVELLKFKYRHTNLPDGYKVLIGQECKVGQFTSREKELISHWALQAEKVMHGNPSGIDNSVCTFGSIIKYRKGCSVEAIQFPHQLKSFLIDTAIPKDTKAQVLQVAQLNTKIPLVMQHILQAMEAVSQEAVKCLQRLDSSSPAVATDNEYNMLNTLFEVNQNLLRTIGVSHSTIEHICTILKKFKLHGKITGAGGGGYVLCLVPLGFNEEILEEIEVELKQAGYHSKLLKLGCDGVGFGA